MTDPVRIGAVGYLNARPLTWGLLHGPHADRYRVDEDVPARLFRRVLEESIDVALLPIVALASKDRDWELVPGLAVGTRGPSRSVLLISRVPVDGIETVATDPESRTSNVLLRVLFDRVWQRRPEFVSGQALLEANFENCDACLRIGDKALFEGVPEGAHVYDLGQVWTEATGLPFVYAAWLAPRGRVDATLYRELHRSRRFGASQLDRIASTYEFDGRAHPERARRYLEENIRYRLGIDEVRGIKRFLADAERLELLESPETIRFALERRTECHEFAEKG